YELAANTWLRNRNIVLGILMLVIILNLTGYLTLFIGWKTAEAWSMHPSSFFTVDYAVIKFAIILLLSHILAFNSKNYSINKNLAVTNKHRKNVAETITNFLESNPDEETRSQIIK